METQEVTLHNELKRKSIFLRDFTTAAQMLWQVLRRCFGRCCSDVSAGAAQMLRQVLRPGCERCLACGHRSGVECRDKGGMDGVAGNKLSINEISILVVPNISPRECLC